jgi:hypothetical protein
MRDEIEADSAPHAAVTKTVIKERAEKQKRITAAKTLRLVRRSIKK